jgi:hypothetical protein
MIFQEIKTIFRKVGLPPLAEVGPKNRLSPPESKTVSKKISLNSMIFQEIKTIFRKVGLPPLAEVGPKNRLSPLKSKTV